MNVVEIDQLFTKLVFSSSQTTARLHSPASFVVRYRHVSKFYPVNVNRSEVPVKTSHTICFFPFLSISLMQRCTLTLESMSQGCIGHNLEAVWSSEQLLQKEQPTIWENIFSVHVSKKYPLFYLNYIMGWGGNRIWQCCNNEHNKKYMN